MIDDPRDRLTLMDHVRGFIYRHRWGRIGRMWRKRLRQADRELLFGAIEAAVLRETDCLAESAEADYERRTKQGFALHIWLDSAWRFRDEWKDEPEAEWFLHVFRVWQDGTIRGAAL